MKSDMNWKYKVCSFWLNFCTNSFFFFFFHPEEKRKKKLWCGESLVKKNRPIVFGSLSKLMYPIILNKTSCSDER